MFRKLFGTRKVKPAGNHPTPTTDGSSVLKIVHPGGTVETYYMAIPARTVIQKYPSSVLAKPDVFRRPWEATIRPEVILVPGQKFFIVPRRTLKKLRRTIPKPVSENSVIISGYITAGEHKDDFSGSESFSRQGDTSAMSIVKWKGKSGKSKSNGRNSGRRVRFLGVDSDSSVSVEKKAMIADEEDPNKRAGYRVGAEKRTVRHMVTWQPQLTAITELHGMNE